MPNRLALLLAATWALAGCAQPTAPLAPVEAPVAPLQALGDYQVRSLAPAPAVLGVAPPVSGRSIVGDRFVLRPETHEVLRLDDGGLVSWGGLGAEAGKFNHPESLAVSFQHVFVADTRNHRIQAFDFAGAPVARWGSFGLGPGQFIHPRSVELLLDGRVVVTDDHRIQYFEPDGTFLFDFPIALPAPGEAAATGLAAERDRLLQQLHAVTVELRTAVAGRPGAEAAVRDALAQSLASEPQARYAAAVLASALQRLVSAGLTDGDRTVQQINVGAVGGVRAPGDMDLETLMMAVQSDRAALLEGQLKAQIEEVQRRNALTAARNQVLNELRARRPIDPATVKRASLGSLEAEFPLTDKTRVELTQQDFDRRIQEVKDEIDSMSNTTQMDMIRLQSLSNKRNEAFETLTNFIKKMSETRESIIRNMG